MSFLPTVGVVARRAAGRYGLGSERGERWRPAFLRGFTALVCVIAISSLTGESGWFVCTVCVCVLGRCKLYPDMQ